MPYRIRLRKKGESDYQDVGDIQFDVTPRYKARLTIEVGAGVVVGRVANIVLHRPMMVGATTDACIRRGPAEQARVTRIAEAIERGDHLRRGPFPR